MTTPQAQVQSDGMGRIQNSIKRTFDFCVASSCMIVFFPLIAICYILIKLEDGGPAIFSQERIGRYGKPFRIYKFRSMEVDAEKEAPFFPFELQDRQLAPAAHQTDLRPLGAFEGKAPLEGAGPDLPRAEQREALHVRAQGADNGFHFGQFGHGAASFGKRRRDGRKA